MNLDQNLGSQRQPVLVKLIELGDRSLLDVRVVALADAKGKAPDAIAEPRDAGRAVMDVLAA